MTARLTLPVSAARYTGGTAEQEVSTMTITCNLYINGQWHDAEGRRTFTRRHQSQAFSGVKIVCLHEFP
ncbi:hypothetical protein ACQR7O_19820, partial [Klebsiella pneumoniae]